MRLRRRLVVLASSALAATVLLLAANTPAAADTHRDGAMSVDWSMSGPGTDLWNIDQIMWLDTKAYQTFWAMQFPLVGTADSGYMGLQTGVIRPDGSTGEMAIFSLWNASDFRNGDGTCATFGGEGNGLSCRMNFTIQNGTHYRYRVWRLDADAGGQWWGAWIHSDRTGRDYHLGDLRIASRTLGVPVNFTEYFGEQVPCSQVQQSVVNWTQPAANSSGNGAYQYYSKYAGWAQRPCLSRVVVSPMNYGWTQGVKVDAGAAL